MSEYYYLVSSLPLLDPEGYPSINVAEFLDSCNDFLLPRDMRILEALSLVPGSLDEVDSALPGWTVWESTLRNTILQKRKVVVSGTDKERYISEKGDFFAEIEDGVQEAFQKGTPLEREKHLDRMRWSRLEDMELGHDFDFQRLSVYKLKLLLCLKQSERDLDKGSENYDHVITAVYGTNNIDPPLLEEYKEQI